MSVQSDIEMIYIQSMEAYANRNHISIEETVQLFHEKHMLEKMLLQHEYLHQISFEEIMEYVESIVKTDSNELTLYHGAVADFDKIELTESKNYRDFGKGFYTTVLEKQATEWAYRKSLREKKRKYFVYRYLFTSDGSISVNHYDSLNKEWFECIKQNICQGGLQRDFDVVIGPVADDDTMETVQLYIGGILTADEAVERLRYNNVNNQVSFHTEKALKVLKFVGRVKYER